ncbi:hypothetical protein FRX31_018774 [Thalictrum thalictroides]|uniref:Uncharacterized protein n=1 Tax=Thalictrum thalictroides TaxID=46969 RepID=A0A7J6W2N6_THATH|nr:hypothetical protein FRX31_018774 [Thalictrum thalictroides]
MISDIWLILPQGLHHLTAIQDFEFTSVNPLISTSMSSNIPPACSLAYQRLSNSSQMFEAATQTPNRLFYDELMTWKIFYAFMHQTWSSYDHIVAEFKISEWNRAYKFTYSCFLFPEGSELALEFRATNPMLPPTIHGHCQVFLPLASAIHILCLHLILSKWNMKISNLLCMDYTMILNWTSSRTSCLKGSEIDQSPPTYKLALKMLSYAALELSKLGHYGSCRNELIFKNKAFELPKVIRQLKCTISAWGGWTARQEDSVQGMISCREG